MKIDFTSQQSIIELFEKIEAISKAKDGISIDYIKIWSDGSVSGYEDLHDNDYNSCEILAEDFVTDLAEQTRLREKREADAREVQRQQQLKYAEQAKEREIRQLKELKAKYPDVK